MAGEASPRLMRHDVFISFRGKDTRYSFVGNLLQAFRKRGIDVFFDDKKLKRGRDISLDLFEAIEESRISVIVFSEDYASSTWCLRELAKIIDCMKKNKQLVFPVFYKVDPSDVRHQRGSYKESITAQEKRYGKDSEEVQKWRSALSEVANLKGDHFRDGYDYEFKFIEKIVKEVSKNLPPKPLHIGEHLVGLESRVEETKSLLDISDDNSVCMLGIYGAGGIGKTALAKVLYNKIAHQFEGASFLSDVREKSEKGNGMEELQKTLLSEIMREKIDSEFDSTIRGMTEIKRKLCDKKVLLVLDDVDDIKKLEKLAGGHDWFGFGSRIVITTRNKDILDHKVEKIYKMTELNDEDSLELFCWHAFEMSHPATSFKVASSRAVGYAKGLPLALKVIGSNLSTISLEDWESTLEEYERIPNKEIQNILKVSYDSLEDYAQYVFLDIACFFKGETKEYVREILDACEYNAKRQIDVLVNKSLITIEQDCLKMHDLIQYMGRDIVRQEAKSIGKRSRLWFHKDVIKVLTENSGSRRIEGIVLDPPQQEEVIWDGDAFKKMTNLRILIVRNTSFSSGPTYLPNDLRLLHWEEYPSEALPQKFYPEKIVVFNLCKSHLTRVEPLKTFSCLTCMNFSDCKSLTEVPDVTQVENLRVLRLDYCKNLKTVHESVGSLKKLVHLSASECTRLKIFLRTMFLPSLETLDLNFCIRLKHFPDIREKMNKSLKIYMIHTAIQELPESISNLTGLDCIEMRSSKRLRDVPSSLFMLPNFAAFKIGGCSQLRESFRRFLQEGHSVANTRPQLSTLHFRNAGLTDEDLHAILKCFPNMEDLNASENNFVSVPECIKECVNLTTLDVSACSELQKIPECTNLRILDVNRCGELADISKLPSTIQKVDARYCLSLTSQTSTMLWSQAQKEIYGLEIVMPKTAAPEWFDYSGSGGTPLFWARGKFPVFALALVFEDVNGMAMTSSPVRQQLVDLHLFINGQCRGYYNFTIAKDHVLLCDLRVMFSNEEWLGLDTFLQNDWNYVQVSYELSSSLTLSSWGVYVYKQQSRMEDVAFMCPDPKYSDTAIVTSTNLIPASSEIQRQIKMIKSMGLADMSDGMLMEAKDRKEKYVNHMFHNGLMGGLNEISMQAKAVLDSHRPPSSDSKLGWLLQTMQEVRKNEAEGVEDGPSVFIHEGLALVNLKNSMDLDPNSGWTARFSSSCRHEGSSDSESESEVPDLNVDPWQQELFMAKFREGMSQGLGVAKLSFPTLDIDSTINAALNKGNRVFWQRKGNRVFWQRSESEVENNDDVLPVEMKAYMEGIVNGLLEARLSFPTLDIKMTTNAALSGAYGGSNSFRLDIRVGKLKGEPPFFAPEDASSSRCDDGSSASEVAQGSDPQQELLFDIFLKGMGEGLRLAKLSFPTLNIDATMSAALNKPNQVLWERSFSEVENNGDAPSLEMKAYMEGVVSGLSEARLSFPTLDIYTTMNAAFRRAFEGTSLAAKASKFFWYTREKGSPPTSGNPGSSAQSVMQQYDHPYPLLGEVLRVRQQILGSNTLSLKLVHGEWKGNDAPVVLESSSFPHEGSSETEEVQGLEAQQWMTVLNGMMHGLREAKLSFPALDIDTTINAILNKGIRVTWPEEEDKGYAVPPMELNLYLQGMINGLKEAQLRFPTLDITNTIISSSNKEASKYEGTSTTEAQASMVQGDMDSTTEKASTSGYRGGSEIQYDSMDKADRKLKAPLIPQEESDCTTKEASTSGYGGCLALAEGEDNPLLQALMIMGEPSLEPDHQAKGNLYGKLKMEHQALRRKFEDFENEAAAPETDGVNFPCWKNQYDELVEKFNTQSAEFLSVKHQRENSLSSSTTDAQAISELSATRKGGKGVMEYQKLGDAWKGRAEELRRLYDARIEGLKKSELFEDLMTAIYLEGLRDGLLEAQVSFLALHMDTAHSEEHIVETAADNQNHEETTVISGTPESDPPTAAPASDFPNFEEFASFLF